MTVAVVATVLLMAANLRGVRESGTAFAVPTYAFMAAVLGMAAFGFFRLAFGDLPAVESAHFTLTCRGPVLETASPAWPAPSCCCGPSRPAVPR